MATRRVYGTIPSDGVRPSYGSSMSRIGPRQVRDRGAWLRIMRNEVFETAVCVRAPVEERFIWTDPQSLQDIKAAKDGCHACPALLMCRQSIEALAPADRPCEVVQAGIAWEVRLTKSERLEETG